ncbi:30S ribosomal protein S8 [Candidatus Peregrinibacteria bacterium]|nr:30S ribosomal protein S8 [Candidatus Peregrinibacteria bacterium]
MTTDPIADLLTRIRNATSARQSTVRVPHSRMKMAILAVLKQRHFVDDFKLEKQGAFSEITLTLNPRKKITNLTRASKPGQRLYKKKEDLKPLMSGYGISIVSTSKGVMTGEDARKQGIGGELLCEIW